MSRLMHRWFTIWMIVSCMWVAAIVIADEYVQVVIESPLCEAPPGQVRPSWPLPSGCDCSPWKCWLPGRVASSAIDMGEVRDGIHHWILLVDAHLAAIIRGRREYVTDRAEYTLATPGADSTYMVEVESLRCPRHRAPDAGTPVVEVPSVCLMKLKDVDTKTDTIVTPARLMGSYSGVVMEVEKESP